MSNFTQRVKFFLITASTLFFLQTSFGQSLTASQYVVLKPLLIGSKEVTISKSTGGWPGGELGTYAWSISSSNGVTTAPNIAVHPLVSNLSYNTNSITLTIKSTSLLGTYTVRVSRGGVTRFVNIVVVDILPSAAPNLWAVTNAGTSISSMSVTNGGLTSIITNLLNITFPSATGAYSRTAALGRSSNPTQALGYFYWLGTSSSFESENNGLVEVFASDALGLVTKRIASFDLNGSANDADMGFVRLGMGPDGTGWLLASDNYNVLHLAKFKTNGSEPTTVTLVDNDVTLAGIGANNSVFRNGDLCLDGNGTLYVLANNGSGQTQIYMGTPNGTNSKLTKKWDLEDQNGDPFFGSVNGVAFDLAGSLYISTEEGISFIDQHTTKSDGTVQASFVQATEGIQDLASNYFPMQSSLPVKLISFNGSLNKNLTQLVWEVENEVNFSHYEVERSVGNADNFVKIAHITAEGSAVRNTYNTADNISSVSAQVVFYRLKMVDVNESFQYSSTVLIRKDKQNLTGLSVSPNPIRANDIVTLRYTAATREPITIRVFNLDGRVVLQQQSVANEGVNSTTINDTRKLTPGNYVVQLFNAGTQTNTKLTVIK